MAPFGDTTLLEWKISQCKEIAKSSDIYITSSSSIIENIAQKENINYISRTKKLDYKNIVLEIVASINADDIMWINPTSPFMGSDIYKNMYNEYTNNIARSVVSVNKKNEYVFYKNKKLNFNNEFISRTNIEPVYIMTNGCYITQKLEVIKNKNIVGQDPILYEVDLFSSIEIKDIDDYNIAKELISIYFKREFNV